MQLLTVHGIVIGFAPRHINWDKDMKLFLLNCRYRFLQTNKNRNTKLASVSKGDRGHQKATVSPWRRGVVVIVSAN
jgi:hypothetical protein